ncbi:methionyl-tRNA formyltransferase [Conexibacter sp. JD483]|uniref:methionyl-tRNA formyltransferase n=1 Tax=unclassified Conexibacter TaxID=2627773 RepID=UPI0027192D13|nr:MULTISPECIES: methionyl-tRNA formyltransferase [unclassified Conexibacter]MDO8184570.1 methionyl-tRNA formyltransferase [Conexibacter sp. CPCC 205706]MDO8197876.1 methionyl-tRNA formyltransferase [Conexibacter sp. CPCC 205762]MDR9370078.1 methionyl-tRNA formyltransferase [Conexibacter sp. JD483]
MRTVYLGTSDFAAAILRRLADSPHRPQLVVTRPDRPKGRGRRLQSPPVADAARELGIELDQPADVNGEEARARISAAEPGAVIVCAFGALIKEPLLSEHEIVNVHPSLLPRWRGAAPLERAIMAGDAETGVAIMQLTAGLDSGPVALVERAPIGPRDDYGALAARLETIGGELLVRALSERPPYVEQTEEGLTYAEKIGPEDRTLDPARDDAAQLDRTIRALHPHIGTRLPLGDEFLGVLSAQPADGAALAPGALEGQEGRLLLGAAGGTVLELLTVQPPGKRAMAAADYLRGRAL